MNLIGQFFWLVHWRNTQSIVRCNYVFFELQKVCSVETLETYTFYMFVKLRDDHGYHGYHKKYVNPVFFKIDIKKFKEARLIFTIF